MLSEQGEVNSSLTLDNIALISTHDYPTPKNSSNLFVEVCPAAIGNKDGVYYKISTQRVDGVDKNTVGVYKAGNRLDIITYMNGKVIEFTLNEEEIKLLSYILECLNISEIYDPAND